MREHGVGLPIARRGVACGDKHGVALGGMGLPWEAWGDLEVTDSFGVFGSMNIACNVSADCLAFCSAITQNFVVGF